MPMMMDDDLDDLFGEAPQLSLPPALPAKGFLQRVDEIRLSGCCQKVVWSKLGCIAYVSDDGHAVYVRCLVCSSVDGQWRLSQICTVGQVSSVHNEHQIVHLSWNHSGSELAIVDVFGRISICSILIAINRITIARPGLLDPEDSLNALVGMTWLNVERLAPFYRAVIKCEDQWGFSASQHKPMGPFNPSGKSGIIAVTRGGMIRLIFQSSDNRWQDLKVEIDGMSTFSELLTHAAICPDKDNTLLLATHTVDKLLRVYRVNIDFQQPLDRQKIPPTHVGPMPVLHVQHLKLMNECSPLIEHGDADDYNSNGLLYSQARLSHLELVPAGPDARRRDTMYPVVLAIFSMIPDHYQNTQIQEEPLSIISRWELRNAEISLHKSFEQLSSQKSNAVSNADLSPQPELKRLADKVIDKTLLCIQQCNLSTVLAMIYSDGLVEFRDRVTMENLPPDEGPGKVSSLSQFGFCYQDEGPHLHAALSPNFCTMISLNDAHETQLRLMQLSKKNSEGTIDDSIIEEVIISFVLQFAISCASHNNNDDLLAIMQLCTKQVSVEQAQLGLTTNSNIEHDFLSEIYRVLSISMDHSIDPQPENLFRNPLIQHCLSVQASLGFMGLDQHRRLGPKVAWMVLHLRTASLTYAFAFNNNNRSSPNESELRKPEVLFQIQGLVAWSLDVMNFIIDELFTLSNIITDHGYMDLEHLNNKVQNLNSPALPLLLISSSRSFLHYNCRALRGIRTQALSHPHPRTPHHSIPPTPHSRAFRELEATFAASPIKPQAFEQVLTEIDKAVKDAYTTAHLSDAERQLLEKEMLISAAVPEVLRGVVEVLLGAVVERLRGEVDGGELFFRDLRWLGLGDEKGSDEWRRMWSVDAIRKVVLGPEVSMRRCPRCCAVMEDLMPVRGVTQWMVGLQRSCFCGAFWMVGGEEVRGRGGVGEMEPELV